MAGGWDLADVKHTSRDQSNQLPMRCSRLRCRMGTRPEHLCVASRVLLAFFGQVIGSSVMPALDRGDVRKRPLARRAVGLSALCVLAIVSLAAPVYGATWTIEPTLGPPGPAESALTSVSCVSAATCSVARGVERQAFAGAMGERERP